MDECFREYAQLDRKRVCEELTLMEFDRWNALKRQLNRRFSPGLDDERADQRQSVRVRTRLRCSFESFGNFESALITNLSRGGLFVETPNPLPIGTKLALGIVIKGSEARIEISGVVVSQNVGPRFETGKVGMGVRFSEGAPKVFKKVHDLYEQLIRSA